MREKKYIGVSYIGEPRANTVMYIAKKVESLLNNLKNVDDCLIFAEDNIHIPKNLSEKHTFVLCRKPQYEYAKYIEEKFISDNKKARKFHLTEDGYYVGENVKIGSNAYIEPGCVIGHDVIIGMNVCIRANACLRNTVIGDNVEIGEGAIIGGDGFALTKDENDNWYKLPTLGLVIIGNNVEIGANDNISRGTAGPTVIEDYVKIDALVHIGHDAHLLSNTEITAGGIIGGYSVLKRKSCIGLNATIRNRIEIGNSAMVGMGSTVTKSVSMNDVVVGCPAKKIQKK